MDDPFFKSSLMLASTFGKNIDFGTNGLKWNKVQNGQVSLQSIDETK